MVPRVAQLECDRKVLFPSLQPAWMCEWTSSMRESPYLAGVAAVPFEPEHYHCLVGCENRTASGSPHIRSDIPSGHARLIPRPDACTPSMRLISHSAAAQQRLEGSN